MKMITAVSYVRTETVTPLVPACDQLDAIERYAKNHNIEIIRRYSDYGKSASNPYGKNALDEIMRLVQTGTADFKVILIYGLTRWGRFASVEEAQCYEDICNDAGIVVYYCGPSRSDADTTSAIVKYLKQ